MQFLGSGWEWGESDTLNIPPQLSIGNKKGIVGTYG